MGAVVSSSTMFVSGESSLSVAMAGKMACGVFAAWYSGAALSLSVAQVGAVTRAVVAIVSAREALRLCGVGLVQARVVLVPYPFFVGGELCLDGRLGQGAQRA